MTERVLITGGAGFIGGHLARLLLRAGDQVRVLDNLLGQVHGGCERPDYLPADVELIRGDVRDRDAVAQALMGVDSVVHLTARVGVGQSMYEIAEYASVNTVGTAVLLEVLLQHPVRRLVTASSMSVYGEGLYLDQRGQPAAPLERSREQLARRCWDPVGEDGGVLTPAPTPETKGPDLSSVYALTKYDQERLCMIVAGAYEIPAVALRFFNVYGPDQALSNPYTGVLAIFASRLLNERRPMVFEDGEQRRDFVSVHDVAEACRLALHSEAAVGRVLNIGSGRSISVNEIADSLARTLGKQSLAAEVTGKYRVGDIRHCFADISAAEHLLGYVPRVGIEDGIIELAGWLEGQVACDDVDRATHELESRGLTV
ncbi:MAG: UDP-glucose 4-epimerase [Ilumatobacteraceae bacterium]|nr:UDP-glucose 4-epimerase [Ilumatobacteraceae bacterium]